MNKIGIADTTFSRVNMGEIAERTIKHNGESVRIERYTVPGVKDLPAASKKLIEEYGCNIVLALGMPGPEEIDKQCAHEASTALIQVQLLTNKHILEVFVHMDEANNDKELLRITKDRTVKHALNTLAMLKSKTALTKSAGTGRRQGNADVGAVNS